MKAIPIFLLTAVMTCNAQKLPFLTDPGSFVGSTESKKQYRQIATADLGNKERMDAFNNNYRKRLQFFASSLILSENSDSDINETSNRYEDLQTRNTNLSTLFSYSFKKKNNKLLGIIQVMLANIQRDILLQGPDLGVIYGEKLNFYVNLKASLQEIHRLMDAVEDNIDQSKLYNRILN